LQFSLLTNSSVDLTISMSFRQHDYKIRIDPASIALVDVSIDASPKKIIDISNAG
jgi:hypothetical protein